ncbi:MAG: tRNA (adenosine(37)-N6)-threonylcarbamoyltransferase complex transferase subunit TsaD [Candidatus Gracilibacteria bacterium]|nr:tRNA (adenosine(37)-N6)-threonylcarbamoyltransferase complex transferase subunit TsaD [Candidatus Gracilibacteria bacterium]MDD2908473.1 tRNA (adenosine(37)-N6)-threonylcarbamoyltransferase complex transferase subunit TsaD [Candidatus Gracilibacteria bacterium]
MYILAFETSCDDTSIAIFEDTRLIALDTKSQIKEHLPTCGVVPEVAARLHANNVFLVLENVLAQTGLSLDQIDYIACTEDPGLLPSLYVGLTVAKTISKLLNKPFIPINHIQAHIFANLLERDLGELEFPSVCLTVSGGHNEIYLWKSLFELELLGQTQDDSAGEAFDKVAKMIGEGFPGGPVVSKLASEYNGEFKGIFPKVLLDKESLNFSFSGLKSSVKREIDKRIAILSTENISTKVSATRENAINFLTYEDKIEICFEFENTVIDILTTKLFLAAEQKRIKSIVLAGGVSANSKLKRIISEEANKKGYKFLYPSKPVYSQDNAAMVGILAYYKIIKNK